MQQLAEKEEMKSYHSQDEQFPTSAQYSVIANLAVGRLILEDVHRPFVLRIVDRLRRRLGLQKVLMTYLKALATNQL